MREDARNLLHAISLRPNGAVIRDHGDKALVHALTHTDFVSDVYELHDGSLTARITEAGRRALQAEGGAE